MRLTFTTLNFLGDLFPMLPVAKELKRRGHTVRFAANAAFRGPVTGEGLDFVEVGDRIGAEELGAHREVVDAGDAGYRGFTHLMRLFMLPQLPRAFHDLREVVASTDLLLTHPAQLAAPMVAEATGLPWVTLTMIPAMLESARTVPQGSWLPALGGPFGRLLNRGSWALARWLLRRDFDEPINAFRRSVGLPPARDVFLGSGVSPRLVLVLCHEAYCGRPPDWGPQVRCVGFTPFDAPAGSAVPPGLDAFLGSSEPPVLVTMGTSASLDPGPFLEAAGDALERLGLPGLFLVGYERNLPARPRPRSMHFPYVPLSRVLGRCALAVHTGGFGTTAAVLQAGLPSVVVPRALDQFFHAARIRQHGLGRVLSFRKLSPASLGAAISAVREDPGYRERAERMRAAVTARDGVLCAADEVERVLASS
jgi:UDP:flavonoid glycosyltransferase YjiC (YdhE family)